MIPVNIDRIDFAVIVPPYSLYDNAKVHVSCGGKHFLFFEYYPEEMHIEPSELEGLTLREALDLKKRKLQEYYTYTGEKL